MKRFADKVAVITGAGSGIGRALALELADRGARLALSDVDLARVAETAALCEKAGAKALPYQVNVADRTAVLAHADEVAGEFGAVNLVVNNAGVALSANVDEMRWDDLDWLMNINFWGVAHGTKAFLPYLIESGDGHLVNVSSVFGFIGVPTQSAYNAAKFAVRGFTEALRQEMLIDRRPVGVSCVHPGGIKTNIVRDARSTGALRLDKADRDFQRIALTTPARAARTILRGVQRNKPRILIGPDAYVFDALPRVLGARYQRLSALIAKGGLSLGSRLGRL
ncbi:SDR family NAD(P)-dependent oxidoreductase [Amycolatopsis anabasis]|uniref:SDR family NAD(P)-dependent oxidoreductase n=1 Tax=Amycolatopsis anabasis TaxID=1840409 RepID=UPI00131CA9AC|nr:SDR family NAD(P)-dependent oxidoreductase [Amycolatopsis anabasis]